MTDNQKLGLRIYYSQYIWRQGLPPFERLTEEEKMTWFRTLGFQGWFLGRQVDALKALIVDELKSLFYAKDRTPRN